MYTFRNGEYEQQQIKKSISLIIFIVCTKLISMYFEFKVQIETVTTFVHVIKTFFLIVKTL